MRLSVCEINLSLFHANNCTAKCVVVKFNRCMKCTTARYTPIRAGKNRLNIGVVYSYESFSALMKTFLLYFYHLLLFAVQ